MSLRHVGIRPKYKLIKFNSKLKPIEGFKYEIRPDGSYRLWSGRMLKSGCNKLVDGEKTLKGLVYCKYCNEFFSKDQFEIGDSDE